MKKSGYIFMLMAACCSVFGCASTKDTTETVAGTIADRTYQAAKTTYNAIEKADTWIQKNMW